MITQFKELTPDDTDAFTSLLGIFREVFESHQVDLPPSLYLKQLLEKPDFLVIVALHKSVVIGGLTVHLLNSYYAEEKVAYIYDIGVHPKFQRKGVGKDLLTCLQQFCVKNNIREAYVEAESDDQDALEFYKSTPYHCTLNATHFTYLFQ